MKFDTHKEIGFKPFAVTVTFETKEDALTWANMMSYNLSIPCVAEVPEQFKDQVATQMSAFRRAINGGLTNAS